MRKTICKKFFLFLLLLSLATLGSAEAAEKKAKDKSNGLPPVSAFEVYQIGDSDLVVSLMGKALPLPEVSYDGNQATLTLRGAYWSKAGQEHRLNLVPMVTAMTSEQIARDLVVKITTDRPIQLRSVRGVAPSDSYTLRLMTMEQHQKMIEEPIVTKQPMTPRVPTGPFAVNVPITLDLRDTELRDVFRMLGMHLKKNIIIDQSLPSVLVTMTLKDVPLSEAFSYLMKTYDISYETVGKDTLVIGTTDGLSKIAGKEETRGFRIAYADPAVMQSLLVQLTKIPADRLIVDPRLRTIYATSHPAKLEELAVAIQRLDHPGKQIMLHARILEFSENKRLEVEQMINAVYDHWWFNYLGSTGARAGYADDNRQGRNYVEPDNSENYILPTMTDLVTPMQGVWREFDFSFRAVEEKGGGKTLANPSVITIDGQEASISLTQDFPYISGRDDGGNPSWSTETVGPQLKLTPTLGRDGVITIKLNVETGEVIRMITGSTGEEMPQTSKRSVTTNVRVRNGEPFVVGGLFSENDTKSVIRVPILGSIPILGELFTFRKNNHEKTQVVIIVVPFILDTPDVPIDQEHVMYKR